MRKFYFFLLLAICSLALTAQTNSDFENLYPGENSFSNNSGEDSTFIDGNISIPNSYNEEYSAWSGFAISSTTDVSTRGYVNQYSSISGSGAESSSTYAVSYAFSPQTVNLTGVAAGGYVEGLFVNNATFTYWSMKEGDSFAKRFGGVSGDDEDYLKLVFTGYLDGEAKERTVDFFLADFRFSYNSMDYIIEDWTWVDLSALGDVDYFTLGLESTDIGDFGMNTPAYVCIDNVTTADVMVSNDDVISNKLSFTIFPNPSSDYLELLSGENDQIEKIHILNSFGVQMLELKVFQNSTRVNLSSFSSGNYYLKVLTKNGEKTVPFTILK